MEPRGVRRVPILPHAAGVCSRSGGDAGAVYTERGLGTAPSPASCGRRAGPRAHVLPPGCRPGDRSSAAVVASRRPRRAMPLGRREPRATTRPGAMTRKETAMRNGRENGEARLVAAATRVAAGPGAPAEPIPPTGGAAAEPSVPAAPPPGGLRFAAL